MSLRLQATGCGRQRAFKKRVKNWGARCTENQVNWCRNNEAFCPRFRTWKRPLFTSPRLRGAVGSHRQCYPGEGVQVPPQTSFARREPLTPTLSQ